MKKTEQQIERERQIYQITTMVAGNFELQEVLDRLAEAAVKITHTQACSIRLLDDDASDLKMRSTYGLSESYRNKGPVTKDDPVIKEAFRGREVVLDDMRVDSRVKYQKKTIEEGLISQLTVPMIFRGKPIGVVRLYSPKPNRFGDDARSLARLVATQCAVAITNARLYSRAIEGARISEQMRLGAVVQRRMIPDKAPCVSGLDIAAAYQPCFQVGGDLYDFFMLNEHTIAIGISDVIGKGIPAAIMMSLFKGTIRAYSDGGFERHSMEEVITKLNNAACRECREGEFITLFIGAIDTKNKTISYCNCGHEPAFLIRCNQITELNSGGMVLGIMPDAEYEIGKVEYQQDDIFLMFTDGLIDAMNFDGDIWGKEELLDVLNRCNCQSTASELVRMILQYRRRFVGLAPQIDDTSIVAVRFDENAHMDSEVENISVDGV